MNCGFEVSIPIRNEREARKFAMLAETWPREQLIAAGFDKRLAMAADPGRIDRAIFAAIRERMKEFPRASFGITGPVGCGKTSLFAVAAMIHLEHGLKAEGATVYSRGERGLVQTSTKFRGSRHFLVVDWPRTVHRMKMNVSRHRWDEDDTTTDWIMAKAGHGLAVILDDIGAERLRGADGSDWALEQFDLLVDTFYKTERPLFWTTNHDAEALREIYGARTISRLLDISPLFAYPANAADKRGKS